MSWLLSPLAWLLFAGVILLWACLHRRWLAMVSGSLIAAVALAVMTPLGSNALARSLERPFLVDGCADAPSSLAVVLGGGVEGSPRHKDDFSVLNLATRRRIDRAAAWWHEREGRILLLQGGAPRPGLPSLAELMSAYAQRQGVPAGALRLETRSVDTWSNAHHAAKLSPSIPRRIVLVTSFIHMRRAREAFVGNGFEVCPLGTDRRRLPSRIPWALVPRTSALANAEVALHEWSGLIYYRWRAREGAPQARISGT